MYKKKAVIRAGIHWDLDEDYLRELFTGVCPVFGCAIHVGGAKDDCKAELDRLIPSKGILKAMLDGSLDEQTELRVMLLLMR